VRASNYSFFVTSSDWSALHKVLFSEDGCENAGAFLCGLVEIENGGRLLAREFLPVPTHLYQDRQPYHLEVAPQFYNDLVTRCEKTGLHPVIVHSHRMAGVARYSHSDDFGESHLLPVIQSLLPEQVVASLVVTQNSAFGRRFIGRKFVPLIGMRILGPSISSMMFRPAPLTVDEIEARYDRQVRAFGPQRQRLLKSLQVGIIGLGGTGSIVAEQVARLGVGRMILADNDVIENHNLSRVIGSTDRDIGKAKVVVLKRHLSKFTSAKIVTISDSALKQSVLVQLRECDIVFSCVDNDRSRAMLNRFAYQYFIPVIDMGVRLDARSGFVSAAAGRVSLVGPDITCLRCSHHINSERIRSESLPRSERDKLANEGYVMGLEEAAPAVISLNTVVAGLAVTGFLNMLLNLTGGQQPTNLIYDATAGSMFPVIQVHELGCDICDLIVGVKGLGDAQVVSAY
jgi:hypothetical protein